MRERENVKQPSLIELADALGSDSRLDALATYCKLRELGLRDPAFESLRAFLRSARSLTVDSQRELALKVLELSCRFPFVHAFLSQPLRRQFLEPVLADWVAAEPRNATALSELGLLTDDTRTLEQALQLNPRDSRVRSKLIRDLLEYAWYATHHLDEGTLILPLDETRAALGRALALVDAGADDPAMMRLRQEATRYLAMLADWELYERDPKGTFPEWCRMRGRDLP